MRITMIVVASVCGLMAAGAAILAAPEQTAQPGQMTQANVWVRNHGKGEAVPVALSDVTLDAPLRVRVINGPGAATTDEPVNVRIIRQPVIWEYQTLLVKPDDNLVQALNTRGASGWDTTGVSYATPEGLTLVLKRLR